MYNKDYFQTVELKGVLVGHDGQHAYIQNHTTGATDALVFPHVGDAKSIMNIKGNKQVTMRKEAFTNLYTIN